MTLSHSSTSLFSFSTIVAAVLVVFSGYLTPSFCNDVTYSDCDPTFTCGSISNITYPFTGGDRPDSCGPPGFRLTCRDNHTEFTTNSVTYRVLQINQTEKTITLARLDLWNNTCPPKFINSTLDSTIFDTNLRNEDLTLFYGCSPPTISVEAHNLFNCSVSGLISSVAIYLIGPVPSDPIVQFISCNVSITVPVLREAGERLIGNRSTLTLRDVLMEGFSVNYSDPYDNQCSECTRLGGRCTFDSNSEQPVCMCSNGQCPVNKSPPSPSLRAGSSGKKSENVTLPIGLAIGGTVFICVGLVWFFLSWRQKKKQRLAAASLQTKSKDLEAPPSSKGLTTTPSTNFSQSIPSYPSSKSDLENASTYFGAQVFTYAELEEATENFDASRELGDGGFGTVYYGKLKDGRIVAVKRLYENNFKRVEQFVNEVRILTTLRHENLVTLHGCTSKRSRELLLVYEYISNGTVADHLHGKRSNSGLLSWPVRLNIAIETAEALAYLHASDVIHRDVKTNNILLENDFHVKVADFGLSRLFPNDVTHVSTAPQGTPGYVDPEYYQCYQLTEKSDVYSFGVVLVELISSKQAVDTNRHRHDINLANMAVNKIQNHTLHELVDPSIGFETDSTVRRMATLVAQLAFRCLQQEKDMRPSMGEVLEALKGIKNEEYNAEKAEIVDIVDIMEDDVGLLKANPPPFSPDSHKWVSSSTTPNSSG
ncbi:LEAF RUST 10 DISEASE-RESISTANCE LOCUS RECEPTOR-LIKE PROTEIN KINASE-like 1.4 isoform X2 [Cornus florida]|uniref:LEAF RUST 10 DISEASE-RESISTANCE LOCUS RECEPTOR-LIKE PROTEIN KINASE-like 1.4 isoform X2 n=1 Tax=Cornus florida TaxID=4283 RepID=UPI002896F798|nr:LEAF RUST 10 DISEASE-RESISTANCE LOCUS RECEPTOR-LIKE PROTEIN KINASE-like 1.4 isoform X2 [Cornus florida]